MHSEPLVLGGELADGEELSVRGAFFAAGLARLLVGVGVEVVVVDVLGSVLSVGCVGNGVEAAIGHVVPACLGFISQEEVRAVVPSEPLVHLLAEVPNLVVGLLVQPVVQGAVELLATVGRDLLREFAFESGEHVVELEGVG